MNWIVVVTVFVLFSLSCFLFHITHQGNTFEVEAAVICIILLFVLHALSNIWGGCGAISAIPFYLCYQRPVKPENLEVAMRTGINGLNLIKEF
jgi:hypothetical protein